MARRRRRRRGARPRGFGLPQAERQREGAVGTAGSVVPHGVGACSGARRDVRDRRASERPPTWRRSSPTCVQRGLLGTSARRVSADPRCSAADSAVFLRLPPRDPDHAPRRRRARLVEVLIRWVPLPRLSRLLGVRLNLVRRARTSSRWTGRSCHRGPGGSCAARARRRRLAVQQRPVPASLARRRPPAPPSPPGGATRRRHHRRHDAGARLARDR